MDQRQPVQQKTNALYQKEEAAGRGKKSLIVTYTSCTKSTPQSAARHSVHNHLKKNLYAWTGSADDAFLGVVCSDFSDEELAWLIYRRNFFDYRVTIRGIGFSGETPFPDYELCFNGSSSQLQSCLDRSNLDIMTHFNGTIDGKHWHPVTSKLYSTETPERLLTARDIPAYRVDYSSVVFEDGQLLLYLPLTYDGRKVTVTYHDSGEPDVTNMPDPQTVTTSTLSGGGKFTRPAGDPVSPYHAFDRWLFPYGLYTGYPELEQDVWDEFDLTRNISGM